MRRFIIPLAALLVIVLDQIAKALVVGSLTLNKPVVLVENLLRFRYTHNTGAAFGFFKDGTGALSIAAVAIVIAILVSASRMGDGGNRWAILAMGLVVGGALGNLIDRLRMGYVVDFIEVYGPRIQIGNSVYTWPVFNVADSAITVGVVVLLVTLIFGSKPEAKTTVATVATSTNDPLE